MNQLEPFRKKIDALDIQIIELLGKRFDICRQVAHLKKAENIPMMQSGRVEEVKKNCQELAVKNSMNPDFMREVYSLIIEESCRTEDAIIEKDLIQGE